MLETKLGHGILVNGRKGRTVDLITKQKFRDVEVHLEFLIPKSSNSGVKFEGLYEIQILDSFGVKKPKGSDCGGIYPRAEEEPQYHHIEEGVRPARMPLAQPENGRHWMLFSRPLVSTSKTRRSPMPALSR